MMENTINIEHILAEVKKLNYSNRLYLIERIVDMLKKTDEKSEVSSHRLN